MTKIMSHIFKVISYINWTHGQWVDNIATRMIVVNKYYNFHNC